MGLRRNSKGHRRADNSRKQLTRARLYNGEAEPPDGTATMKGERHSNISWIEPIGGIGGRQSLQSTNSTCPSRKFRCIP